jgi:S-adenosylmethionine:tRNA ribosyltransferase-isomerase
MVLHRDTRNLEHRHFYELPFFLRPGDVLVMNDSRVIPARLIGHKPTGGRAEILLLKRLDEKQWEALVSPGRRLKPGAVVLLNQGTVSVEIGERLTEAGTRRIRFRTSLPEEVVLQRYGQTPLPPYIKTPLSSPERYQTVYARVPGSAAAPTAGLHFTKRLLQQIQEKGVEIAWVTLHIGLDTFRPIREENVEEHRLHTEEFEITPENADKVNQARGRVIAVGTTSVRALESAADENGVVHPGKQNTGLYIFPGYRFKVVQALITNFHLPRSTLLVLVSAFAGRDFILQAYQEAIRLKYRFYSFGDAMLIL